MTSSSEAPGFYKKKPSERLDFVKKFADLSDEETKSISGYGALGKETANRMIENVVGTFPLPLGIAANFMVNKKEYMVPMALEEPSVVAAATHMAKGTRKTGGINADSDEPIMIGQIQLVDLDDTFVAKEKITAKKEEIIDLANKQDPILVKFGGGFYCGLVEPEGKEPIYVFGDFLKFLLVQLRIANINSFFFF